MPTYVYGCDSCGHRFEKFQKFTDAPLTDCPECGANIRKIFQPAGIVFKGSGWYYTDSRSGNGSRASTDGEKSAEPSKKDTEPAKSSGGDGAKTTEKPAAKAESAATA